MFSFLVAQGTESVLPPIIPAAPTSLVATADSDSIGLTWTNGDTYSTVTIDRKTTGDYSDLATIAGDSTSYDDTTAIAGTTYTYRIKGLKATFPSLYSNTSSDMVPIAAAHSANLNGTTGYLLASDPIDIRISNTDSLIIGMWIKATNLNDFPVLVHKPGDTAATLLLDTTGDIDAVVPEFGCQVNATEDRYITSSVVISNNTKYFVLAWKNPTVKTLNISVNNSIADSLDYSAADDTFTSIAGNLAIGARTFEDFFFGGLIDEMFVCKNPSNLATALSTISSTVYNSGTGARYSALSSAQKTTIGLVSWWGLDESSGTRLDLHGTANLTPSGGVTQGVALVA